MGTKDTPAMIDYMLKQTGASKINYIGHSEGTTQLLAGASLMPEYYTPKINHAALLAPVTTFRGTTNKYMHFWA
jgi:lysosomal acid lipase/cholesteryl ester hydrolase